MQEAKLHTLCSSCLNYLLHVNKKGSSYMYHLEILTHKTMVFLFSIIIQFYLNKINKIQLCNMMLFLIKPVITFPLCCRKKFPLKLCFVVAEICLLRHF